ncbi:hypothetical protein C8R46DRAFT_1040551 [Mycena filopes]|nr:hypothetical protein C8R46DRAFT_1040551 [Mycena filopes]
MRAALCAIVFVLGCLGWSGFPSQWLFCRLDLCNLGSASVNYCLLRSCYIVPAHQYPSVSAGSYNCNFPTTPRDRKLIPLVELEQNAALVLNLIPILDRWRVPVFSSGSPALLPNLHPPSGNSGAATKSWGELSDGRFRLNLNFPAQFNRSTTSCVFTTLPTLTEKLWAEKSLDMIIDFLTVVSVIFDYAGPFFLKSAVSFSSSLKTRLLKRKRDSKREGSKAHSAGLPLHSSSPLADPPTQNIFSDLVGSVATFIASRLNVFKTYEFDGVDIDWESAFSTRYGLSFTAPSSFWYLQHFDLKSADWVNVMFVPISLLFGSLTADSYLLTRTYDLHGTWDGHDIWVGLEHPFLQPSHAH